MRVGDNKYVREIHVDVEPVSVQESGGDRRHTGKVAWLSRGKIVVSSLTWWNQFSCVSIMAYLFSKRVLFGWMNEYVHWELRAG